MLQSSKQQRLLNALQESGSAALLNFWDEIGALGTPIVETDGAGYSLVTFLWRDEGVACNVAVIQDFGTDGIREHQMQRMPDSDIWYLTRRMRSDTRTTYQISPSPSDDPVVAGPYQLDPLNPKTYPGFLFEDGGQIPFSLLELPDAPPLPWREYMPALPATVALYTPFADQRRFWLYAPPVASSTPLPVLVVFDGWVYKEMLHLPQLLDYLIETRQIPPVAALMIDNKDRSELQCRVDFADYVAEKVMPWLCTVQPITGDPRQIIALGSSLGGLAAFFLGYRCPNLFGTVFAQTGWFRWMPPGDPEHHWLARQVASRERLSLRIIIQVGDLEVAQMADGGPTQLEANRHLRNMLQNKGYEFTYHEYSGGHDTSSLQAPLAKGLVALLG